MKKDKKALSEAARLMGSSRSEKKTAAVQQNGQLGGRPLKSLSEYKCTCGSTDGNHKFRCAYGRAYKYRQEKNLPLE
jgi:hypothetical protein